jgi:O-antigen/teichoic acid export membrane protein
MSESRSFRRLLKGGGLVTLGNLVAAGLGLLLLLVLARSLSPAELAVVIGVIVVIDGGQMFLDATVNTGMINLASRHGQRADPSPDLLRAGFWTKIGLGLAFAAAISIFAGPMSWAMIGDRSMTGLVMLAGVGAIFAGMQSFVLAVLTAREAFGRIALTSVWKNLFRLVAVMPFLLSGKPDAHTLALAICVVTIVTPAASLAMVSWSFLSAQGNLWEGVKALQRVNGWMLIAALAMLGGRLDVWLVGTLGTAEQAGYYAVAAQLCVGLGIVTQAMVTTLLPTISRMRAAEDVWVFLRKSSAMLAPLFLLPLLAWPVAGWIIELMFGLEYVPAAQAFVVLFLAAIMTLVGAPLMLVLLSVGEARVMALAAMVQFLLRVLVAVPLITTLGASGMALADVGSRLIAMLAIGYFIWRALQNNVGALPGNSQSVFGAPRP